MIFESIKLKSILELIFHPLDGEINLEISKVESDMNMNINISLNYGNKYYIRCSYEVSDVSDVNDNSIIVVPKEGILKLYNLVNLWPKSKVNIEQKNGMITFDIVDHGKLIRENPVTVECLFKESINDYVINPPKMRYNCSINSKNLKQMLEFCNNSKGVILEVKDKSLIIINVGNELSLSTLVDLEELIEPPSKKMILSVEAINLIISFLNKIIVGTNFVYLLFLENENAFSIKINIDEFTTIQIYTIHD
jgi:hypothetical protein